VLGEPDDEFGGAAGGLQLEQVELGQQARVEIGDEGIAPGGERRVVSRVQDVVDQRTIRIPLPGPIRRFRAGRGPASITTPRAAGKVGCGTTTKAAR
jgi:hypothetical protein